MTFQGMISRKELKFALAIPLVCNFLLVLFRHYNGMELPLNFAVGLASSMTAALLIALFVIFKKRITSFFRASKTRKRGMVKVKIIKPGHEHHDINREIHASYGDTFYIDRKAAEEGVKKGHYKKV